MYATWQFTIQAGVKSITQQSTREMLDAYSYANQPIYRCRYIETNTESFRRPFAQEIKFDVVVWTRAIDNVLPNRFSLATGEYQQVKITDRYGTVMLFNALSATDLSQFPIIRAIAMNRWA